MNNIAYLMEKGFSFKTKSGLVATFVAILAENIPYRLVVDLQPDIRLFDSDIEGDWEKYEGQCMDSNSGLNNYLLSDRFNEIHESELDLVIDQP